MSHITDPTAYCRRQAIECAASVAATKTESVKEAYRNLELAWLELARNMEDSSTREPTSLPSGRALKPQERASFAGK